MSSTPAGDVGAAPEGAAALTTGASVMRGSMWNTASRVVPQVCTVVLSIAAARFLGVDDFGRQSYIAFVETTLVLAFSSGVSVALVRFLAELRGAGRHGELRGLIRGAWVLQAGAAAAGGSVLLLAALAGVEPEAAWVLAGVACALGIMQSVPGSVLVVAQRWREASIVGLVTVAALTPATIAVLALGGGIAGMFAIDALITLIGLIWTSALARRYVREDVPAHGGARGPSAGVRRRALGFAGISTLQVAVTVVIWRRSEFLFLAQYSTDEQIALYSIAFAGVTALMLVPETVNVVTAPAFATLYGAGQHERIRAGYQRALRLLVFVSLPLTAFGFAFGPPAVRLVYGADFAGVTPILLIMLALLPFLALSTVTTALLVALERPWPYLTISLGGAVAVVALNFLLVPPYEGIGAALANTGGQTAVTVPLVLYANRLVGGDVCWHAGAVARTAVAAVLTGGAGWGVVELLGDGPGLAPGIVAAAAAFVVLAGLLRALSGEDASWMRGLALGRHPAVDRLVRLMAPEPAATWP